MVISKHFFFLKLYLDGYIVIVKSLVRDGGNFIADTYVLITYLPNSYVCLFVCM